MVRIRQITTEELFKNKENLKQYLSIELSQLVDENTWMSNWEQLANRFQLIKFENMSEEDTIEYSWDTGVVEQAIQETIKKVNEYFPFEELVITVVPALPFPWFKDLDRSQWINGFTNGSNNILIAVPPNPDIEFLQYLSAHEAHHAYSENAIYKLTLENFTLADWLKMEGTAEYFSLTLFKDKRWWQGSFSKEVEKHYWSEAKSHLKTTDDQIKSPLCFGEPSKGLPMMCGYSFGYRLVKSYMELYPETNLEELFYINIEQLFSAYERKR